MEVVKMENTKSMAIVARDKAVIAPCQRLAYYPLVIESAEGAVLKDVDGFAVRCSVYLQ